MRVRSSMRCLVRCVVPTAVAAAACLSCLASERITLSNGFSIHCDHRQALDGDRVRLYLDGDSSNYVDIALSSIAAAEPEPSAMLPAPPATAAAFAPALPAALHAAPAATPLDALIRDAGQARSINIDLLRAVVNAESGGHARAVSRTGAQGLMQLMPATAHSLGVQDSFEPRENLRGGTDYLDMLLRRYHDDLPLALAAYNAGPGAVDRYHGIPPYRETRLYVARIIREFNRRTLLAQRSGAAPNVAATHEAVPTR